MTMVAAEGLERSLREHPVFADMSEEHTEVVSGCAANEVFKTGHYIYREGEPADKFYLVRHGAVALEVHVPGFKPIIIATLHPGDLVGWSWLLPPYRTAFDARASQVTRVISIDAKCLRGKMDDDPALGYTLFKRMAPVIAERLASTRRQMIDLYGHPDPERPE
jgi:CRP-like cAMP-binding protein